MSEVKYPKIKVKLTSIDGNAFLIIGAVLKALRQNNVSQDDIDAFKKEATSGDYDNVLCTCMRWVNVC